MRSATTTWVLLPTLSGLLVFGPRAASAAPADDAAKNRAGATSRPSATPRPAATSRPSATSRPAAGDAKQAKALFMAGVQAARAERWPRAVSLFRRSLALVPRPSTLFNLGASLLRVSRPIEARALLERFLRESDPKQHAAQRAQARAGLAVARKSIATLTLTLAPPAAAVSVDGARVAGAGARRVIRLDPGRRRVELSATGHLAQRFELDVAPGARLQRRVALAVVVAKKAPAPPAPPPRRSWWRRRLPWILGGGALATAVAGAVLLGVSASKADDVSNAPARSAWSDFEGTHDSAATLGTVGAILLGVGAAGVAGCLTWAILGGRGERSGADPRRAARVALRISPTGATLLGRF